jgi:hypothetical protein
MGTSRAKMVEQARYVYGARVAVLVKDLPIDCECEVCL